MQVDLFYFVRARLTKAYGQSRSGLGSGMEGMRQARRFDRRRGISYITS